MRAGLGQGHKRSKFPEHKLKLLHLATAQATSADAVLDSYFQVGGSFLARL